MELLLNTLREHGVPGRLGPALADYLDALDSPNAVAHRRTWTQLADAHAAHQSVLADLGPADLPAADGEAREALRDRIAAVRRAFAALSRAEAPPRRALRPRLPRRDRMCRARRLAVASMYLDAALEDALAED